MNYPATPQRIFGTSSGDPACITSFGRQVPGWLNHAIIPANPPFGGEGELKFLCLGSSQGIIVLKKYIFILVLQN